jgi:hypothetical protein
MKRCKCGHSFEWHSVKITGKRGCDMPLHPQMWQCPCGEYEPKSAPPPEEEKKR